LVWSGLSLVLHALFELALFSAWREPDRLRLAGFVIDRLLGDVLVAALAFLAAAALFRDLDWPLRQARRGALLLAALGIGYALAREWLGVHHLGRWHYGEWMPVVLGIGVTPLLQWLAVSLISVRVVQRLY
jgi:hypothetical protein